MTPEQEKLRGQPLLSSGEGATSAARPQCGTSVPVSFAHKPRRGFRMPGKKLPLPSKQLSLIGFATYYSVYG